MKKWADKGRRPLEFPVGELKMHLLTVKGLSKDTKGPLAKALSSDGPFPIV